MIFRLPRPRAALPHHGRNKRPVDLLLAHHDPPGGQGLVECHAANFAHAHHLLDHSRVVRRQKLAAGRPVGLHGVIAGRVVAGRDHDAAHAPLVPHRKRQLGRAAVAVQEINLEAGRHHDFRTKLSEVPRAMPGVVGHGAGQFTARELPGRVIGQPLGRLADGTVVDGVGADGIHHAPPPAGAEGNRRPEDVVQLLPLSGRHVLHDLRGILGKPRQAQPQAKMGHGPR